MVQSVSDFPILGLMFVLRLLQFGSYFFWDCVEFGKKKSALDVLLDVFAT